MLEIEGLHVKYGVIPALHGISLSVKGNEIVSLIGANGAGKTTTLRTISGIVRSSGGSIKFEGQEIISMSAHKIAGLGVVQVPEGRGVFPNLTVMENLSLGAYLRKDKKEIEEDEEWVFTVFPRIHERKKQLAGTLSGGELQMLAIARAMMARPRLLLLDEPSMGLSPILVEEVFRTILELNRDKGVTILLVEQNALMALQISDRAYVMETGEIVASGVSRDLLEQDEIRRAYLGV